MTFAILMGSCDFRVQSRLDSGVQSVNLASSLRIIVRDVSSIYAHIRTCVQSRFLLIKNGGRLMSSSNRFCSSQGQTSEISLLFINISIGAALLSGSFDDLLYIDLIIYSIPHRFYYKLEKAFSKPTLVFR